MTHYRARIGEGEVYGENHLMRSVKTRKTEDHVDSYIVPIDTSITLMCYGHFKRYRSLFLNTKCTST